jgi:hypothetical protein
VPHLEPYPHHCAPLDVVGLGEGRLSTARIDVPDNDLDPMVTMLPVRGGRASPPIKTAISVNPAASAFVPFWAATAASVAVRAATMVELGVRGCPLRCLLPRCLPR